METRPSSLTSTKASLSRPSAPIETRVPRAPSTRTLVLLTAPVTESVFERKERLAVKYWGFLGNAHLFVRYLKRPSGELPLSRTWASNDRWPDMLHSLSSVNNSPVRTKGGAVATGGEVVAGGGAARSY